MRRITIVAVLCAALLLAGCYSDEAKLAVEANGFSNVVHTGHAWWGCGDNDSYRNAFTAIGPNGKRVEVVACGGFLKGWTVRITKVLP